jgi:asparagine synthetase B (glutamine-hydrolysing)
MRGDKVTPQPLVSSAGDVLLWNGEIFDGVEVHSTLRPGTLNETDIDNWMRRLENTRMTA